MEKKRKFNVNKSNASKKKYKYVSRKKVLTAEEKEKKRKQQILKNRQLSKNSRQRKEQRFTILEKEVNRIQADVKIIKHIGTSMETNDCSLVFKTLLKSDEFWNRKDIYNNNNALPSRRLYDHKKGIEYLRFLPSKILENRDGTRKRPFVNPVTCLYQNMQREIWRKKVINDVGNTVHVLIHAKFLVE